MREVAIVLGVIKQGESYLLQLRTGNPRIGAANMVGCFGGKIEPHERSIDAMCRELSEETSLRLRPDDLEHLGSVAAVSDHNLEPVQIKAEVYYATIGGIVVEAMEGELVRWTAEEAAVNLASMTPGTRAVFETFVLNKV